MGPANGAAAGPSSGPGGAAAPMKKLNVPQCNRFNQQELPACKPILTPKWVISVLVLVAVIFIPIGLACLLASNKVPKDMNRPIYVYYQLDNFYQNHRRYVKSRNDGQLTNPRKASQTTNCGPEATANGSPIVPCGLIAWSLFNDTYNFSLGQETLIVNKKDISWMSERDHKFGKHVYPKNFQNGTLIGGGQLDPNKSLSEQEDLIVWMRTAALPTFRKLYGRIEVDLKENDFITVTLQNNYNSYSFNGKKMLVLSTTSWLGGKNDFLGRAYLTAGMMCFLTAMALALLCLVFPRNPGDHRYFLQHYPSARVTR